MSELLEEVRRMSDTELRDAAARIRGTAKRGARRKLTEAETRALAAVYEEQSRRERSVTTGSPRPTDAGGPGKRCPGRHVGGDLCTSEKGHAGGCTFGVAIEPKRARD
jgi:hypothetical protein